ncbi:MAG TPA: chorismate-binding protein [Cytophagaceae bacterium]|nr:chorismate-binding protein [Cytophagaceae bacterium]
MGEKVLLKDPELLRHSGEEIAFAVLAAASEKNISYACWRLPQSTELFVLLDFSESVVHRKPQLEKAEQGFIIQPFLQENKEDTIFLHADLLFSSVHKEFSFHPNFNDPLQKDSFLKSVSEKLKEGNHPIQLPENRQGEAMQTTEAHYLALVDKAKEAILENRFKKVVLARSKAIETTASLDVTKVFQDLSVAYPNAFISLINTKETGTWLTASPEILASMDAQGVFKTIALAGTQLLREGDKIQKAVWTQKEIEEQALVGRYIINCFKKIRLREYEEEGPRTVQSGNLLHLRTDYTFQTNEQNFPELGTIMLELLHPTSAVCGMPKEVTLEFIKEHESLERKLFSGYLGPVNINSASHIFVNLRCANLYEGKAVLYAGAGVTQDSEAEKEFKETEVKMEAVGRFFKI